MTEQPSLDFTSGYVQRSIAQLPKQGSKGPWRLYQNYALDIVTLRYGKVDDWVMQYSYAEPDPWPGCVRGRPMRYFAYTWPLANCST